MPGNSLRVSNLTLRTFSNFLDNFFLPSLPEISSSVKSLIVDKISEKVFLNSGISLKVSISAGMAGYPSHAQDVRELISLADKAMYVTKSKGGNGVSIAEK